jgi:pimeloyl-ACP methyl ester carboxylesterase
MEWLESKTIDVDGVQTRYFDLGSGEPIVLWHGDEFGGAASASTWRLNLEGLATTHRVIAPDRLGQGLTDSPSTESGYTAEAVVDHMRAFHRAMGLRDVVVGGQSRGAYFAARLALEEPGLARAMVMVDTASLAPDQPDAAQRMARLLEGAPADPVDYARFRWTRLSYSAAHIDERYVAEVRQFAEHRERTIALAEMRGFIQRTFTPSFARQKEETLRWLDEGRLTMPVLMIWAQEDPLAPVELGHELFGIVAKSAPYARMYVFNRSGHFPYREHPREFNRLVSTFADESRNGNNIVE